MRISATCFARIKIGDRYVLLLNRGRMRHNNQRVVTPVGGALAATDLGLHHLISLGARNFENPPDMRFCVNDEQVPSVVSWFALRQNREVGVWRELHEELTAETGALSDADLVGTREIILDDHRQHRAVTARQVAERNSLYLIELSEVSLPDATLAKLLRATELPVDKRWVYMVTPQEIAAGRTQDDVTIGQISRFIL